MAITRHIEHIKSKVVENNSPKLPTASQIHEGEIAVNFAKDYETLSIRNSSGDIVTFSSDSYYTDKKLGSGFTGENSANTVTSVIESNERVVTSSLNDLNERKLDASAYTPTDLSNYYTKSEVYAKGETSGATELTEAFGNFYTKDEIDDVELTISSALNDLNERKLDASAYTPIDITNYYTKADIDDKSEIVSESLNDLNKRVNYAIATAGSVKASTAITSGSTDVVTSDALYKAFYETEKVSSAAFNDLNSRLSYFEDLFSQAEDNKVLGQVNGEIGWYYINQFTNPS